MTKPEVGDHILAEVIRQIVEAVAPERIVLFGSAARGEAGPESDLDLLVVKRGEYHPLDVTGDIYINLIGAGAAVDVIVATPEDVEHYRDSTALVIAPALREGRVVYAA